MIIKAKVHRLLSKWNSLSRENHARIENILTSIINSDKESKFFIFQFLQQFCLQIQNSKMIMNNDIIIILLMLRDFVNCLQGLRIIL